MSNDKYEPRAPTEQEIEAIVSARAAPGLFAIGDCDEHEFRRLLVLGVRLPVSYEARPGLLDPPDELREHLPGLLEGLREDERDLREQAVELHSSLLVQIGIAYWGLPRGNRGQNLMRAIACYEAALRVYTEDDFPQQWAMTQNNLANACGDLPTGDRGVNLQRAIACYEAALRVRTEDDFPQQWAATQNNLAIAYCNLPTGDRGVNLQRAIAYYEAALRVYTEDDFPQDWAMTQNNLANAYGGLPTGDRGVNLQRAIACYEAALRVRTEDDFPQQWAATQNNLAIAYRNLPTGDRGVNLQRAIACYEAALRVYTEHDFPQDWAMTQNNLAIAYRNLPTGDRGVNLQRAIACYEAALRVYTEHDFPQDWAMTQNNLANAYGDLPTGDRGVHLQRAIACYEAALRVLTEDDFPQDWATTQNNLAIAYCNLPTGDRGVNLQRAIACYEAALRVYTEHDFPQDWAMTQNNLANAYADLLTGDRGVNLQHAIACYEAALRVLTEDDFPQDWATTQNNLAIAYSNLPTGDRGVNLRRAIACYEAAYRGYTQVGVEAALQQVSGQAGQCYEELPNLDEACVAYRRSMDHFDRVRAGLESREYKEIFQGERLAVFGRAAGVMLRLAGQAGPGARRSRLWAEAFETAERAKCRILAEMVAHTRPGDRAGREEDGSAAPVPAVGRRVELDRLVEEVLEPGAALLEYEKLPDGRIALFAVAGKKGLLGEPALLEYKPVAEALTSLLGLQHAISEGLTAQEPEYRPRFLKQTRDDFDGRLARLAEAVLPDALHAALRQAGIRRLVVVPDHLLHWVPFHALAWRNGHTRYLADDFQVSYAPQAGVYAQARGLARERGRGLGLVACGPHSGRAPELVEGDDDFYRDCHAFDGPILERLGGLFRGQGSFLPQATPDDFRREAPGASLLHFFGHGSFGFRRDGPEREEPDDDVVLRGEAKLYFWQRPLSNRDLHGKDWNIQLRQCAMLTLAACSVGQVDFQSRRAAREVLGLSAALFERQVPALVSALWPAQVGAALAFFERFYAHFAPAGGPGLSRLDAYDRAQRDLRDDAAFAHPYLWAPFYLSGADN